MIKQNCRDSEFINIGFYFQEYILFKTFMLEI